LENGEDIYSVAQAVNHSSLRMTLRYAAISTETVRVEYNNALNKLADRYKGIDLQERKQPAISPQRLIRDIQKWLRKNGATDKSHIGKKIGLVNKRLNRMADDLKEIQHSLEQR